MRLSIRSRTVLAMNILVTCVGVAVGWAGIEVSSRAIERRLIDEPVKGAARTAGEGRWPVSGELMAYFKQIIGAEFAAGPADKSIISEVDGKPVSSLSPGLTAELAGQFTEGQMPRRVTLGGMPYRVGTGPIEFPAAEGKAAKRLFLLLPESQLVEAQGRVRRTIIWITAAAIVAATVLAFWLSGGITRPVARLAERMDRLGRSASAGEMPERIDDASDHAPGRRDPRELARLAESFDRLVAELSDARAKLARSARLAVLGQLSASIAHELRNPLSGIKMNARVLADELARASMSDPSLDLIVREIDRMDLYVSQLLGTAAGAEVDLAGAGDGKPHVCDLGPLVESVMPLVNPRCRQLGIEISRDVPGAPCLVRGAARALRQVVLNLVLNAMDAMPTGGAIRIALRVAEPGRPVRLAVTDSGPGIDVPDGTDIFEPFVTTKPGSAGLGLHVCRQIVTAWGGRIGYDRSDSGATFWFELPAAGPGDPTRQTDGGT